MEVSFFMHMSWQQWLTIPICKSTNELKIPVEIHEALKTSKVESMLALILKFISADKTTFEVDD